MTRLLVAMDDDVLVAVSGGGGWRIDQRLAGTGATCLAADPTRPGRVWCGTSRRGLWRSDDGGATWEQDGGGFASDQVTAVAVGPDGVAYAGTEPSALYRAEGGGRWRELAAMRALPSAPTWSFPPRPHTSHVRQILPEGERLAVCIEAGALVRSTDGGQTWIDRVADGPQDTHTLHAHPMAPDRWYSAAGDGFGRSRGMDLRGAGFNETTDAGATWRQLDAGLGDNYLWGLAVDPGDPDVMIASVAESPQHAHNAFAARATVYRRAHGGDWAEVREGLPDPEGCVAAVLAANGAEPGVFYAASNMGLYRSADGGETWSRMDVAWPERYERMRVGDLLVLPE
jgi:photosystem II stability/assembly factor-like uncharacterized protein